MNAIDVTLEQIEDIFFKAMQSGYASNKNSPKQVMEGFPGYKCIKFESGEFTVIDAYCVTPLSNMSSGFTTIWFNDVPVWTMSYGEQYSPSCIPLLKLALQKTYQQCIFCGCRGPHRYDSSLEDPCLIYFNDVEANSNFTQFRGRESIIISGSRHTAEVGFHRYVGMALI